MSTDTEQVQPLPGGEMPEGAPFLTGEALVPRDPPVPGAAISPGWGGLTRMHPDWVRSVAADGGGPPEDFCGWWPYGSSVDPVCKACQTQHQEEYLCERGDPPIERLRANVLRRYASRRHGPDVKLIDGKWTRTCWCGSHENCSERRQLLADADKIEKGETP